MTRGSEELKSIDIDALVKSKRSLEEKVVRLSADNVALSDTVQQLQAAQTQARPGLSGGGGGMGGSNSGGGGGVSLSRALPPSPNHQLHPIPSLHRSRLGEH